MLSCPILNLKFKFGNFGKRIIKSPKIYFLDPALLPGHAKALNNWREFAEEEAAKGVIIANINDPVGVSGCRAISWKYAL